MQAEPTPRTHRWWVVLFVVIAVVRGGYWTVASIAPSPVDEMQHVDYARSMARLEGMPTVGVDQIATEIRAFAKQSPTYFFRSEPYPPDLTNRLWDGAPTSSYEGIQGPTYYGAVAPFYWLGRPWGMTGSFYALRMGSVFLGALAIPLTYLLGRRLLPRSPGAWLVAPGLLSMLNGLNAGTALVSNDALVLTGTALTAVLLLRALDLRTLGAAALAGATAGLVLIGKTTAIPIVPLLLLLGAPSLLAWAKEHSGGLARWLTAFVVSFAVPVVGWFAWNLRTYEAISAAARVKAITGPLQPTFAPTFDKLQLDWQNMRTGFWAAGGMARSAVYGHRWELLAVVAISVGLVIAARTRGRRDDDAIGPIAWGAVAYPLTFTAVAGSLFVTLDESGPVLGRYGWAAVVPTVLAIGLALHRIAPRHVALVALVVLLPITWSERQMIDDTLRQDFERDLAGGDLAPVVDQSWNDGLVTATAVDVDVTCDIGVVDLALEAPPPTITVENAVGSTTGRLTVAHPLGFSRYQLDAPTPGPIFIPLIGAIGASGSERAPEVKLVGGTGDPSIRVHCPVDDPGALRFDQVYDPGHPPVPRWLLQSWPDVVFGLVALTTAGAAGAALRPRSRSEAPA